VAAGAIGQRLLAAIGSPPAAEAMKLQWLSSTSQPTTPHGNLLETTEYAKYAWWCERGKPRGVLLLNSGRAERR